MKKPTIHHVFSLGTSCHTAFYLKSKGYKKCSLPLDWVATANISNLMHILSTDFTHFMDPREFHEHPEKTDKKCGHAMYHPRFFNHFNPREPSGYEYYQRCITRLYNIKNIPSNERVLFLLQVFDGTFRPRQVERLHRILSRITGREIDLCCFFHTCRQKRSVWKTFSHNENIQIVETKLKSFSLGWKFEEDKEDKRFDHMIHSLYRFDIRDYDGVDKNEGLWA